MRADYARLRDEHAAKSRENKLITLEDARGMDIDMKYVVALRPPHSFVEAEPPVALRPRRGHE